ncbi:hypothetical protein M0R45_006510 [Rubus argutus]|uniref:Uncharacterized protein n=1 Tax=Rubus argutus TaxID=59490 RepID=A0AAW1YQR0_RUBAR
MADCSSGEVGERRRRRARARDEVAMVAGDPELLKVMDGAEKKEVDAAWAVAVSGGGLEGDVAVMNGCWGVGKIRPGVDQKTEKRKERRERKREKKKKKKKKKIKKKGE